MQRSGSGHRIIGIDKSGKLGGHLRPAQTHREAGIFMATVAKKRVLLVDDDPELVESVRIALMSHGYEVLVATDGAEALARGGGWGRNDGELGSMRGTTFD